MLGHIVTFDKYAIYKKTHNIPLNAMKDGNATIVSVLDAISLVLSS